MNNNLVSLNQLGTPVTAASKIGLKVGVVNGLDLLSSEKRVEPYPINSPNAGGYASQDSQSKNFTYLTMSDKHAGTDLMLTNKSMSRHNSDLKQDIRLVQSNYNSNSREPLDSSSR